MSFPDDAFLSPSSKNKTVVQPSVAASRESAGGTVTGRGQRNEDGGGLPTLRYEDWIEEGLERSRVPVLCMSANAFDLDWAQSESGTF